MKFYPFNALTSRMKYISRWGLMRSARQESLSEHTADTAIIAHTLCLIAVNISKRKDIRPEKVAVAALYHDASEIMTGDMPTPVKYKNENLRRAYKALEAEACESLAALMPEELQTEIGECLRTDGLNEHEKKLLKAADHLSAIIKCIEEEQSGNKEFAGAIAQQNAALDAMQLEEAEYFKQHMLPCYRWTLDELSAL